MGLSLKSVEKLQLVQNAGKTKQKGHTKIKVGKKDDGANERGYFTIQVKDFL